MDKTIVSYLYEVMEGAMNFGGATAESLKLSAEAMKFSRELWKYLAIAAMGMTIIYFLLEINQKFLYEGRDVTMKTFLIPFCKLFMAIVLLGHSAEITNNVLGFYNTTIKTVEGWHVTVGGGVVTETEEEKKEKMEKDKAEIRTAMGSISLLELIGLLPIALILWLIQLVLKFIWEYKAITFKLELLWRIGMTPIAFSDIYSGQSSNAIRWLKAFIATAIYGAAFILIVEMGSAMLSGEWRTAFLEMLNGEKGGMVHGFVTLIKFIVIPFAELGVLGAVKQITKEAFG